VVSLIDIIVHKAKHTRASSLSAEVLGKAEHLNVSIPLLARVAIELTPRHRLHHDGNSSSSE